LVKQLELNTSFRDKMEEIQQKEMSNSLPTVDALLTQYNNINKKTIEGASIKDTVDYKAEDVISKMLDVAQNTGYIDLKITNVLVHPNGKILSI
jgi:hypothetical protein